MSRLRVRVELNRGGVGVPLHKLASVVQESQRFFEMLAQDVHIDKDRGEWLGFDFDNESLNFTAEYVGPVSAEQVDNFIAAFDGVTSLRRATIAQFTRIADAIGEDELIGFGLYPPEHEGEPEEWRCLSRRDALRIADEIQLLLGVSGQQDEETRLPSVVDTTSNARQFKERRALSSPGQKLPELVREVETTLSRRITRLEVEVDSHSHSIKDLRETTAATEESFRGLLSAVENFCGQATRQLEKLTPGPAELTPPLSVEQLAAPAAASEPAAKAPAPADQATVPVEEAKPAPTLVTAPVEAPKPVSTPVPKPIPVSEKPVERPTPAPARFPTSAPASTSSAPIRMATPAAPKIEQRSLQSAGVPWRALGVAASVILGLAAAGFFWLTRTPEPRSAQAASGPAIPAIESAKQPESSQPERTPPMPLPREPSRDPTAGPLPSNTLPRPLPPPQPPGPPRRPNPTRM